MKGKIRQFVSALLIFAGTTLSAQDSLVQFTDSVSIKTTFRLFTTDNLGNVYTVNKDRITKYTPAGDSVCSQSFKWMGEISSADATNALRIILFSKDLGRVLVLDNTLSIQGESIKLEALGLQFVTLLCQSPNNSNLWAYNTDEFRLLRLSKDFSVINSSGNLIQILGKSINPVFMTEYNNLLYMSDPEVGILVFDMFAGYVKTIPLKNITFFQVIGESLIYLDDKDGEQRLNLWSLTDFNVNPSALHTFKGIKSFRAEGKRLYLHDQHDHLIIYTIAGKK